MRAFAARPFVAALLVLAVIAGFAPRAGALVVGTGRLDAIDFDGSLPDLTFDGTFHWDDAAFDVLGTPVNLGASFPGIQQVADGQVTSLDLGDLSAGFVASLRSDSTSGAFLDLNGIAGSAVCSQPSCIGATATFLGSVGSIAQDPPLLPSASLAYTLDGSITLGPLLTGAGPFGLNAFA